MPNPLNNHHIHYIATIKNKTTNPTTPKITQIDNDRSPSSTYSPQCGHAVA